MDPLQATEALLAVIEEDRMRRCEAIEAEARRTASQVLGEARSAARLPEAQLRAALRRLAPITVVVPDLREAAPYPDVAARMKRQLGIES